MFKSEYLNRVYAEVERRDAHEPEFLQAVKEVFESLELVVYSKSRYQLAHLLEHGHAKRGGGRTKASVHIAPAEEAGAKQLEDDIRKALGGA